MSKNNENGKKVSHDISDIWKKYNLKWVVIVSIWTFILTIMITIVAEMVFINTRVVFAFIILIGIILIGVTSDMVGVAVTVASERPFHAMAADRVEGAKYAIKLLKNAGPVSNFCNDVIGDICGIVSGAAGINIVLQLEASFLPISRTLLAVIMSGFIASLTVGGKAIGKSVAILQSHVIVFSTAKVLNFLDDKFNLHLFSKSNKKNRKER
ncbi:hypothetical protein CACET_c18570 [Clostridium aceticum]|uniref:Uncharacterized protein n=1 Tax=Clostridium aceticum TaxID=84022 RepID=A0A0D8ICW1_9CLOT|nr:hypothetical protein [Clostridium aceticum]AKL95305.1 hypothetical protein CACET_c18570 [Clostridium aceticum]KJF28150.1 hypothetical protein TZ02_06305 [Clostridium aceticum]